MKKLLTLLLGVTVLSQSAMAKDLVIYFSQPEQIKDVDGYSGASVIWKNNEKLGTTEYLAKEIQKGTGADIFKIETVQDYPLHSHQEMLDFGQAEQRKNIRPELKALPNLEGYDRIFVGFPIWWYKMPMPMYSLFDKLDFSGKDIQVFATSGGARFSGTAQEIAKLEPKAIVAEGYSANLYRTQGASKKVEQDIANWLVKLGYR